MIPKDPVICLSFINTQLRDNYKSLDDLCKSYQVEDIEIIERLKGIDYAYDETLNQFI